MTPAQQRVADLWAGYWRPPIHRPTRTFMTITAADKAQQRVEAVDAYGSVVFQGTAIPRDRANHFDFDKVAPGLRSQIVVEDRLGQPRLVRFARTIEVQHGVVTEAVSYFKPCGGYSILHRLRMLKDDGSIQEVVKTYYNGNSQSFHPASIAKRHLKDDVWAVEMEIPANSPGYYGTLLNPGLTTPVCRITRDPQNRTVLVREDWNYATQAMEFHR